MCGESQVHREEDRLLDISMKSRKDGISVALACSHLGHVVRVSVKNKSREVDGGGHVLPSSFLGCFEGIFMVWMSGGPS